MHSQGTETTWVLKQQVITRLKPKCQKLWAKRATTPKSHYQTQAAPFENAWFIQPVIKLIAASYQGDIYMKTCSRCVLQQGRVVCVSLHCLPSKQALPRQRPKHVWQCLLWSVWTRTILAQTCLSTVIHYNPRAAFTLWSTHAWSFFPPLKAGHIKTLISIITHRTDAVWVATTTQWGTFTLQKQMIHATKFIAQLDPTNPSL